MKLAILGPKGTFSENAALKYEKNIKTSFDKVFYKSIPLTFLAVNNECDIGIIPVENTLDGYVQRSLDLLLEFDFNIVDEVAIPVQFSLVSNCQNKNEIKKLFVQFKAHGQCLKIINDLQNIQVITTQSNMESFNLMQNCNDYSCAIIPKHMYSKKDKLFSIENVTDSDNNYTRFFIIEKNSENYNLLKDKKIKVSLYVLPKSDESGILYKILEQFYTNKINLCSIMSRPTKKNLGTYNFYIELIGEYYEKQTILDAINCLRLQYDIKVLGIYSV